MSNFRRALILLILTPASAGLLGACMAPVRTSDGERLRLRSDAFAAYAERVFRLQNDVLDALAFAIDAAPEDSSALMHEDAVLAACAGLNEIAVRRRDGGGTRPLQDAATARRLPECETAANGAAQWLASLQHAAGPVQLHLIVGMIEIRDADRASGSRRMDESSAAEVNADVRQSRLIFEEQ
jgi:hypothetical protein